MEKPWKSVKELQTCGKTMENVGETITDLRETLEKDHGNIWKKPEEKVGETWGYSGKLGEAWETTNTLGKSGVPMAYGDLRQGHSQAQCPTRTGQTFRPCLVCGLSFKN